MKKKFKLFTNISAQESMRLCAELLDDECVLFDCEDESVRVTSTPLPFISIDRRLYSRNNWVGLNPFVFVTGVDIFFRESDGITEINVSIDRKRTLMIYCILLVFFILIDISIPGNKKFILITVYALFFAMINYFSVSLIRREISKKVRANNRQ